MGDRLCEQCGRPLEPNAKHNQRVHPGECRKARSRELINQWKLNQWNKTTNKKGRESKSRSTRLVFISRARRPLI